MVSTPLDHLEPSTRLPTSRCSSTSLDHTMERWNAGTLSGKLEKPEEAADWRREIDPKEKNSTKERARMDYDERTMREITKGRNHFQVGGVGERTSHEMKELVAAEAIADLSLGYPAPFCAMPPLPATHKGLPRLPQRGSPSQTSNLRPTPSFQFSSHASFDAKAPRHNGHGEMGVADQRCRTGDYYAMARHTGGFTGEEAEAESRGDAMKVEAKRNVVEAMMSERMASLPAAAAAKQGQRSFYTVSLPLSQSDRRETIRAAAGDCHAFGIKDDDDRYMQKPQTVHAKPQDTTADRGQDAGDKFIRTGCYASNRFEEDQRLKYDVRSSSQQLSRSAEESKFAARSNRGDASLEHRDAFSRDGELRRDEFSQDGELRRDEFSRDGELRVQRFRHPSDISPDADMPFVLLPRREEDCYSGSAKRGAKSSDYSNDDTRYAMMAKRNGLSFPCVVSNSTNANYADGRLVVARSGQGSSAIFRYAKYAKENGYVKDSFETHHIGRIPTPVARHNQASIVQSYAGFSETSRGANVSNFSSRRPLHMNFSAMDRSSSSYLRRKAALNAALERNATKNNKSNLRKTDTATELEKVRSGKYGALSTLSSYCKQIRSLASVENGAMDLSISAADRCRKVSPPTTPSNPSNNVPHDNRGGSVEVDPRPPLESRVNNWSISSILGGSDCAQPQRRIKVDVTPLRRACEEITAAAGKTTRHRSFGRDGTVAPPASCAAGGAVSGQIRRKQVDDFPTNGIKCEQRHSMQHSGTLSAVLTSESYQNTTERLSSPQLKSEPIESVGSFQPVQIKCESTEESFSEQIQRRHLPADTAVRSRPAKREFPDDSLHISNAERRLDAAKLSSSEEKETGLTERSEPCSSLLPDCQLPPKKRRMFDQTKVEDLLNDCRKGHGFAIASSSPSNCQDRKSDGEKDLMERRFQIDEKFHEAGSHEAGNNDENKMASSKPDIAEPPSSAVQPDEDGDLPLHIAVVQGNLPVVDRLLRVMRQRGVSIDTTNHLRQTPLHLAIITNQREAARRLLVENASTELSDRQGNNVVHLAVKYNSTDCFRLLLDQNHATPGANGSRHLLHINAMNYEGLTPLHLAVQHSRSSLLHPLLHAGAAVNAPDGKNGRTALYFAAERNDAGAASVLLAHGADAGLVSYSGCTAAQAAAARSHLDLLRMLEQPSVSGLARRTDEYRN